MTILVLMYWGNYALKKIVICLCYDCSFPLDSNCIFSLCFSLIKSLFILCSWIKHQCFLLCLWNLFNLESPPLFQNQIKNYPLYVLFLLWLCFSHSNLCTIWNLFKQRWECKCFFSRWLPNMFYWIQIIDEVHNSELIVSTRVACA